MIETVRKFFRTLGYMFAFGMKGANDEIMNQNGSDGDFGIIQNKESNRLSQALKKGEVTQEVEELRYRDYLVSRKSKDYKYIGNGQAIKTKNNVVNKNKFSFIQSNSIICESIEHELNRIGSYGTDRYVFNIIYSDVTKYKIEAYASYGRFTVDNSNIKIELFFDKTLKNKYDSVSYAILKELKNISNFNSSYQIENNDICTNVRVLGFTTYKAKGENDLVQYMINNLKFVSCKEYDDVFILTYDSDSFTRVDLTEKFYSKTMDEKYKNKEPKNIDIVYCGIEREEFCENCGSKINVFDADITKEAFGKKLCQKCAEKVLNNEI